MNIEYESKSAPTRATTADIKIGFTCNLFLNQGVCLDDKLRRQNQICNEWQRHLERLEKLAQPKKIYQSYNDERRDGVPLEILLPRLSVLAKPKLITPKYVKPPEEPFSLPGKIQDWESHKKWIEVNAQPRKLPKPKKSSFRTPMTRLSECNLRRICNELSRPKRRRESESPSVKSFDRFSLYDAVSERISDLCQPKMSKMMCCCCCPVCEKKLVQTAMSYEASDHIKSLAVPRRYPKIKCRKRKHKKILSPSYTNLIFKK